MSFEQAKEFLLTTIKWESRDHAFGDCEVGWMSSGTEVASGYFSGKVQEVSLYDDSHFTGAEADELRKCFISEEIDRNDETGPPEFRLGQTMQTMPGLTMEGVRDELTGD